jgi:hypothetical protein
MSVVILASICNEVDLRILFRGRTLVGESSFHFFQQLLYSGLLNYKFQVN